MEWMMDEEINAKHLKLRGSDNLKYPPNESRCRNGCGISEHDLVLKEKAREHRCFLGLSHKGFCEFSSECGERSRKRREVDEVAA